MAHKFVFNSQVREADSLPWVSYMHLKNEPMLFQCEYNIARQFGGECTQLFLDALGDEWKRDQIVIDARVHMLMPGWYPCIPGWHHDDVPRDREDMQPNYPPRYKAKHAFAFWGDASCTEFAIGRSTFDEVPLHKTVYEVWHDEVERHIEAGELTRFTAEPQRVYEFDWQSWHRGMPAHKNGWRFFIRATRDTGQRPQNEIRRQTQVYLPVVNAGW